MTVTNKRLFGPAALTTSAATKYTVPASTAAVIQRGRVSNPSGGVLTFTMSIGADAAGTRIYDAAVVPPGGWIDIWGPFSLAQGDIVQAFGSGTALVLELSGIEAPSSPAFYTTTFSGGSENPISEGGIWITGTDPYSSVVQMGGGLAYGTQTGDEYLLPDGTPGKYNDSQAYLSGFGQNHRVEVTIHLDSGYAGDLEIECLLGWSVSGSLRSPEPYYGPTHSDGIEVNLALSSGFGIFCGVARWLSGPNAILDCSAAAAVQGIQDGDIFAAQLTINTGASTGTVVVSSTRGGIETILGTVTDASLFRIGQPGMAFYKQNNPGTPDRTRFSATAFTARDT